MGWRKQSGRRREETTGLFRCKHGDVANLTRFHGTSRVQPLRGWSGAGLRVIQLPTLTDVDTITEARSVAEGAPHTAFAGLLNSFEQTLALSSNQAS